MTCRYCKGDGCASCGKHPAWCGRPLTEAESEHLGRYRTFGPPVIGEVAVGLPREIVPHEIWLQLRGPFVASPQGDVALCFSGPCPALGGRWRYPERRRNCEARST